MSQENVQQFYATVQNNEQLQQQLGAAQSKEAFKEKAVQLGQENGYTFTADEVDAFLNQSGQQQGELSEGELEAVAGGGKCPGPLTTVCVLITDCWGSLC